jgi:hypothetical protein
VGGLKALICPDYNAKRMSRLPERPSRLAAARYLLGEVLLPHPSLVFRLFRSAFTGQNEMRFPRPVLWVFLVIAWRFVFATSSAAQTTSLGLPESALEQQGLTWTRTLEGSGNTDGFGAPPAHPLPIVFRSVQLFTKPVANISTLRFKAYSPDRSVESLSPVENNQTLFVSQTLLPLARFWSGRLQLVASESTLHMGNVFVSQGHLGWARSVDLYGVSLAFHFGQGAETGGPTQVWRRMTQFVGAVLY